MADVLDQVFVRDVASRNLVTIAGRDTLPSVRRWLAERRAESLHQGFPVVDERGCLVGIVTRKDLEAARQDDARTIAELLRRPPVVVFDDCTVREAADHMLNHDVGRLPVMRRAAPGGLIGIVTRGDLLGAYRKQLDEQISSGPTLRTWPKRRKIKDPAPV